MQLNDGRATIALCRILRDRAPEIVAALMKNAGKRSAQCNLGASGVFRRTSFGKILSVAALMTYPSNPYRQAVVDRRT